MHKKHNFGFISKRFLIELIILFGVILIGGSIYVYNQHRLGPHADENVIVNTATVTFCQQPNPTQCNTTTSNTVTTTIDRGDKQKADFTVSANPAVLSVSQGNSGNSTLTLQSLASYSGTVNLTASGLPTGVTAAVTPTSVVVNGSATAQVSFSAAKNAAVGAATVTITGTDGTLTHTTTISLTIIAAGQADFTVSATPSSVSVKQGAAVDSTINLRAQNGFNATVALSASGAPSGVKASLVPTSVPLSNTGSAKLTLAASDTAAVGTSTITVTGVSGSLTHAATVTLTVTGDGNKNANQPFCLKLKLDFRKDGNQGTTIDVAAVDPANKSTVAKVSTQTDKDGVLRVSDATFLAAIKDKKLNFYAVPRNYLRRRLDGVAYNGSAKCYPFANPFVAGGYSQEGRVTIGDIVGYIAAYNGRNSAIAGKVTDALGGKKPELNHVVQIIEKYNSKISPTDD